MAIRVLGSAMAWVDHFHLRAWCIYAEQCNSCGSQVQPQLSKPADVLVPDGLRYSCCSR